MARIASPPSRWLWIRLTGPDARDFLHRLTTADVKGLEVGQGAPACFLTAQGKIRSVFHLWRTGEEAYAFELDGGGPAGGATPAGDELRAAIDQYTFSERMTLEPPAEGLACRWLFGDEGTEAIGPELSAWRTLEPDPGIRVCHHGTEDFGRPWLSLWGDAGQLEARLAAVAPSLSEASPQEIDLWRIEALHPSATRELAIDANPLEVGLWRSVAIGKGCYPGQEVIEKISALGSPARRLALVRGRGAATAGDRLVNSASPPMEVGQLTSVAPGSEAGSFAGLALLRKIHAKPGFEAANASGTCQVRVEQVAPYGPEATG